MRVNSDELTPETKKKPAMEPTLNTGDHDQKQYMEYMTNAIIRRRPSDIAIGFAIYNAFIVWDWHQAPNSFYKLLSIRLTVTTIWLLVFYSHNNKFVQRNLRKVYLSLMMLALNSVTIIYATAFPGRINDITLAALTVPFCMSAFHLTTRDAAFVGCSFVAGFIALLALRNPADELMISQMAGLVVSLIMGLGGATISERYRRRAFKDEQLLREETIRADSLLTKTFPIEIAMELKLNHKSRARRAENVTVMFCDIINFTRAASQMEPDDLVDWLNHTFSTFDRLTAEHGCEKIKTVGDAYIAVCGVPLPVHDHADRIVNLALAIQEASAKMTLIDSAVQLRIGINSGPVVAGVIGETRFAYDLWGDTVNTASRMESMAPPGRIQITDVTKILLAERFKFEKVSSIAVKGKGLMDAWLIADKCELTTATTTKISA